MTQDDKNRDDMIRDLIGLAKNPDTTLKTLNTLINADSMKSVYAGSPLRGELYLAISKNPNCPEDIRKEIQATELSEYTPPKEKLIGSMFSYETAKSGVTLEDHKPPEYTIKRL